MLDYDKLLSKYQFLRSITDKKNDLILYIGFNMIRFNKDDEIFTFNIQNDFSENDLIGICICYLTIYFHLYYIDLCKNDFISSIGAHDADIYVQNPYSSQSKDDNGNSNNKKISITVYSHIIEIRNKNRNNNALWETIYMYIGFVSNDIVNNLGNNRILLIRLTPSVVTDNIVNSLVISPNKNKTLWIDFIEKLIINFCESYKSIKPSNSIIDLGYIRDLQAAYGQHMILYLTEEFKKIDPKIKSEEMKCAKFMTLVKPIYIR